MAAERPLKQRLHTGDSTRGTTRNLLIFQHGFQRLLASEHAETTETTTTTTNIEEDRKLGKHKRTVQRKSSGDFTCDGI